MTAVTSNPEPSEASYRRAVLMLVAVAAAVRLFLALKLDLIGSEALLWISARSLVPGGFDSPPLPTWLAWLTTDGGRSTAPILLRLPSLLLGSASTLLLFRWVREMSGPAVGWVAAFLHSLAFLFMSPAIDSSLVFFWLLSAYCGWKGFHSDVPTSRERLWILFLGLPLGLALLSGSAAWLLIPGFAGYLATDPVRRAWLKRPEPWVALGFALTLYIPVVYWNYQHAWAYFRYLGWVANPHFHPLHLLSVVAPFVYLNPLVAVCVAAGVASLLKHRPGREDSALFLYWISIPAVVILTLLSFIDSTSELHAAGVGFLTLIPIAAFWLQSKPMLRPAVLALGSLLVITVVTDLTLNLTSSDSSKTTWRDLEPGLKRLREEDALEGKSTPPLLFARRATDAALAEYYCGRRAVCLGDLDEERGLATARPPEYRQACSGYLILAGADLKETEAAWRSRFKRVGLPRSIETHREGETRERFRVYRCETLLEQPLPAFPEPDLKTRPEYRLFFAVNRGLRSGAADVLIGGSNWLGVGYVGGPIALLLAAWHWRRHPERRRGDLIAVAAAALLCTSIVQPMKSLCARERPPRVFEAAVQKGEVDLHVLFGAKQGRGFPSGHTATAFMVATLVGLILGRRGPAALALAFAFLVGVSTMYIGAHFPGDVVAGAWAGALAALTAYRAVWLWKGGV